MKSKKRKKEENLHDDIVFFFNLYQKNCTIFFSSIHTAKSGVQKKFLMNTHTDLPLIFYQVHKIQTLKGLKIFPMVLFIFPGLLDCLTTLPTPSQKMKLKSQTMHFIKFNKHLLNPFLFFPYIVN